MGERVTAVLRAPPSDLSSGDGEGAPRHPGSLHLCDSLALSSRVWRHLVDSHRERRMGALEKSTTKQGWATSKKRSLA